MKPFNTLLTVVLLAFSVGSGTALAVEIPRDEPTPAFAAVAAAGASYLNDSSDCPGLISAQALFDNLENYTVIDLRTQLDYESGHVLDAYHSSMASILADLDSFIPVDKPLVLVGYTGQVASQVKFVLEVLGYEDVKTLPYGMSSWNFVLDRWSLNVGNALTNPETDGQNENLVAQVFPALGGDPATAVAERAQAVLEAGFRGVSFELIAPDLDDYFVINYFSEADYLGIGTSGVPGHIPGAFQFTPYASLGIDQMLEFIPPDRPVVVYDWTGMHSGQVVAYLNMLGYDAYSLKFGANALFHSSLTAHAWSLAMVQDFPLDQGSPFSSVLPEGGFLLAEVGCYPNPFNPATQIRFNLSAPASVTLEIFNLQGRRVARPLHGEAHDAGSFSLPWSGQDGNGRSLAAGTYLYRLQADTEIQTGRMQLVK